MSKQLFANLEKILEQLAELHSCLLEAAERKRVVIIEGDIRMMEELLQLELGLVAEVEKAEVDREKIVADAVELLGLDSEKTKLVDIIDKLEPETATGLRNVQERLRVIIDELRYRSRQNAELLKASMEHVEEFLRTVSEAASPEKGYGRDGKRLSGGLSLLDRSA